MSPLTRVHKIFSLDLRSLALFRILLGSILLLDVLNRMTLVPVFYSDSGIIPRTMLELGNYEYVFHFHVLFLSGDEWFVYFILGILALLSVFLILGYKTRLVTFFCWFFVCSLFVRNHLILDSQDTLLILLLFWGIFLPIGRVFSMDAVAKNYMPQKKARVFSAATVGLYLQFVLIYIMNGLYKGQYLAWVDGTHLYNTFSRFEFVKPLAFAIYPYFDLLSFLTKFSLYLELFGPLLFFIPAYFVFFRMTGIVLFLGLQISILVTLDIGLFPVVSITGILVLLPSEFWNFISNRILNKTSFPKTPVNVEVTQIAGSNIFSEVFVVIVTAYVLIWNIGEYSSRISLSDTFKTPGYFLKLDQKWALFASPTKESEYFSVHASYDDGTTRDLMEALKTYRFSPNKMRYASYNDYRWRIFFAKRVGPSDYFKFMPIFINYLVDEYGFEESSDKKLVRVDIIPHMHYIGDYYDHTPLQTDIIYTMKFEEL